MHQGAEHVQASIEQPSVLHGNGQPRPPLSAIGANRNGAGASIAELRAPADPLKLPSVRELQRAGAEPQAAAAQSKSGPADAKHGNGEDGPTTSDKVGRQIDVPFFSLLLFRSRFRAVRLCSCVFALC